MKLSLEHQNPHAYFRIGHFYTSFKPTSELESNFYTAKSRVPHCSDSWQTGRKDMSMTEDREADVPVTMMVRMLASDSWWMTGDVSGFSRFSITSSPRKVRSHSTCSLERKRATRRSQHGWKSLHTQNIRFTQLSTPAVTVKSQSGKNTNYTHTHYVHPVFCSMNGN